MVSWKFVLPGIFVSLLKLISSSPYDNLFLLIGISLIVAGFFILKL